MARLRVTQLEMAVKAAAMQLERAAMQLRRAAKDVARVFREHSDAICLCSSGWASMRPEIQKALSKAQVKKSCLCESDYPCIYIVDGSSKPLKFRAVCINCLGGTYQKDRERRLYRCIVLLAPFGAKTFRGKNVIHCDSKSLGTVLQGIQKQWRRHGYTDSFIVVLQHEQAGAC